MPSMMEIYQNNSCEYDELVSNEDYQNNLGQLLESEIDFKGKKVIELGGGTGRVTKLYRDKAASVIFCDGSAHMLERAKKNLKDDRIKYMVLDNLEYNPWLTDADIVIEGWSFGHTVKNSLESTDITVGKLVANCRKMIRPDGRIIIIESLSTNSIIPKPPDQKFEEFFSLLDKEYGFRRYVISTDFRFESPEEAVRMMGFFFGPEMEKAVRAAENTVIPEFTGIWIL